MRSFLLVCTLFLCIALSDIARAIIIANGLDPKLLHYITDLQASNLALTFILMFFLGFAMDLVEWVIKIGNSK